MSTKGMRFHFHKCYKCGHIWRHCDGRQGELEAHTCKKCGTVNGIRYTQEDRKEERRSATK